MSLSVGFVIAVVRGFFEENKMSEAFNKPKIDIPRAPALGLLLDCVKYERYNTKYGDDGIHEKLDWNEYEVCLCMYIYFLNTALY